MAIWQLCLGIFLILLGVSMIFAIPHVFLAVFAFVTGILCLVGR